MKSRVAGKNRIGLALVVAVVTSLVAAVPVRAQVVVTLDENGNGTIVGGPFGGTPLTLASGGAHPVTYTLPFTVVPGDVLLVESNQTDFSDLLRFNNNQVTFFSELESNETFATSDLADVSVPPTTGGGPTLTELGPEGSNGAEWTPIPGSFTPGNVSPVTGFSISYVFISDVPEPASWLLTSMGGGLLLLVGWRRRTPRS
jgi:hypothetical protein